MLLRLLQTDVSHCLVKSEILDFDRQHATTVCIYALKTLSIPYVAYNSYSCEFKMLNLFPAILQRDSGPFHLISTPPLWMRFSEGGSQ